MSLHPNQAVGSIVKALIENILPSTSQSMNIKPGIFVSGMQIHQTVTRPIASADSERTRAGGLGDSASEGSERICFGKIRGRGGTRCSGGG